MRVYRGRADSLDADRAATRALTQRVVETGEPGLRVWYPHDHVAFGRRDAAADGYERARAIATDRGYPPVERTVGGRAVAFTGDVLSFVRAVPADASDPAVESRYEETATGLERALEGYGVDARRGEPPDSFCPGSHSLQVNGKVAGLAQRVRRDAAVVAGIVVVRNAATIADVLGPVYDALGVAFDPESVGSLAAAGGTVSPAAVRERIETALVDDPPASTHPVREI